MRIGNCERLFRLCALTSSNRHNALRFCLAATGKSLAEVYLSLPAQIPISPFMNTKCAEPGFVAADMF